MSIVTRLIYTIISPPDCLAIYLAGVRILKQILTVAGKLRVDFYSKLAMLAHALS